MEIRMANKKMSVWERRAIQTGYKVATEEFCRFYGILSLEDADKVKQWLYHYVNCNSYKQYIENLINQS